MTKLNQYDKLLTKQYTRQEWSDRFHTSLTIVVKVANLVLIIAIPTPLSIHVQAVFRG